MSGEGVQEGERKREMEGSGKKKVLVFSVDQTPSASSLS